MNAISDARKRGRHGAMWSPEPCKRSLLNSKRDGVSIRELTTSGIVHLAKKKLGISDFGENR